MDPSFPYPVPCLWDRQFYKKVAILGSGNDWRPESQTLELRPKDVKSVSIME